MMISGILIGFSKFLMVLLDSMKIGEIMNLNFMKIFLMGAKKNYFS
jgi:ABC-type polysaccharide transport system permease subunit